MLLRISISACCSVSVYQYVARYQYISMSLSISISVCCSVSVYQHVARYQYISMLLGISISVCRSVSVYQYVALVLNLFILVTHEYFCAGFSWFHAFSSHSTRKGGSLYVTLAYRIHSSLEVIFTHAWEHNFLVCGRIPYLRYCLPKVSGTDTNYRH